MKGDVSGMAEPGEASDKVAARVEQLKAPWDPHPSPVELLTLSGDPAEGVPVRASVSEFGAPLLAKVLDLNDVQTSVLSLVFHWADSGGLLLVDLKDLREVLKFLPVLLGLFVVLTPPDHLRHDLPRVVVNGRPPPARLGFAAHVTPRFVQR